MKLSWIFIIGLLAFVAIFSVQNAEPIAVHFLTWNISVSAALVIQLAALLGGLVGLVCGAWSRRGRRDTRAAPAAADLSTLPAREGKAEFYARDPE